MDSRDAWIGALRQPTEGFFPAFARRLENSGDVRGAVTEAIRVLVPQVDWPGYAPAVPHGLIGLWAVLRLEPVLAKPSFLRWLATQLHAFAAEGRAPEGPGLQEIGRGSGHWPHVALALRERRPALAWGELAALEGVASEDFTRLLPLAAPNMANVGHAAVLVHRMQSLFDGLGQPTAEGRLLLAWAGWQAASGPEDTFWARRMARRLEGSDSRPSREAPRWREGAHRELAQEVCEGGLVAVLDAVAGRIREGVHPDDLLTALVWAAAEKLRDARRDLEGKTGWCLVYLATLGDALAGLGGAEPWGQGAALVNFFPSEAPEDRLEPEACGGAATPEALVEAILDGEPGVALGRAQALLEVLGPSAVLGALAEAASANDPGFNQSAQALAVAATAELLPRVAPGAGAALLGALAKSLANAQGSGDLGRRADRAIKAQGLA